MNLLEIHVDGDVGRAAVCCRSHAAPGTIARIRRQYCTIAGDVASHPRVSFLGVLSLTMDDARGASVLATIEAYPSHLRERVSKSGTRVVLVGPFQGYREYSPVLRSLDENIDEYDVPPAGVFVLEERCLYLRHVAPMVVAHEYAHAIDCALGDGGYLSEESPVIRRAYDNARAFVTPYAGVGLDEYFAEGMRAMVGINDTRSPMPPVSPERLHRVDPELFGILAELFDPTGATAFAAGSLPE